MPRSTRKVKLASALSPLLLVATLAGCGSASGTSDGSSSSVVLRVASARIDRGEVEHWAHAIARSDSVGTALGQTSGTPREKALEFLISSAWLAGEATEQRLYVSNAAVERGLHEKIDSLPNGRSEFDEELSSTGQTLADVELEVKTAMAAASLRRTVAQRAPAVTGAEVASYYAHHRWRFYLPDRRVAYLIEGIRSYARALALAGQARSRQELVSPWFRELVSKNREAAERGKLAHMVFTATPGRVAGPAMFFGHWVLAIVKKLIPSGAQSLAVVRGKLSKTLAIERSGRLLDDFAAAFVRKWTARTSCSRGYVVPKCSQYNGAHVTQENPLLGG